MVSNVAPTGVLTYGKWCGVLLAITHKYGISMSQWAWLYQALLDVSMNKTELGICADDWTTKRESLLRLSTSVFTYGKLCSTQGRIQDSP